MRSLVAAGLFLAAFAGGSSSFMPAASACSFSSDPPPTCWPTALMRGPGAPSNLPGFPFVAGRDRTTGTLYDRPELRDSSGRLIATTVAPPVADAREHLLIPSEPLSPGNYTIGWADCRTSDPEPSAVDLREPKPLPVRSGEMRVLTAVGHGLTTDCPLNRLDIDYVFAELKFITAPELEPWMPLVVDWRMTIDGQPWNYALYGQRFYALCDQSGPPPERTHGLPLGKHHVSAVPVIVGMSPEPPAIEGDVTLSCQPSSSSPAQENAEPVASSNAGCSTSPGPRPPLSRGLVGALVVAGTAVLRTRRRRRPATGESA